MDALVGAGVGGVCGLGTHGRTAGGRGFGAEMEASEAMDVGASGSVEGAVTPGGGDAAAEAAEPAIAAGATVDTTAAERTAVIPCAGATPMSARARGVPGCLPLSGRTTAADTTSAATRKMTPRRDSAIAPHARRLPARNGLGIPDADLLRRLYATARPRAGGVLKARQRGPRCGHPCDSVCAHLALGRGEGPQR